MWTAWLRTLDDFGVVVELADPADEATIDELEDKLGLDLPRDLRSLLLETDGLADDEGGEPVWPVERIVEENLELGRDGDTPAMPEGGGLEVDLLFFGDTGGEDLFAYRLEENRPDVYLWVADRRETRWVASDLQSMLDAWFRETGD
ncbi:MAG TPA: SMI1/KNR4 family protein [Sporichthyaceae bacterium]|jgi:hypothetical protein